METVLSQLPADYFLPSKSKYGKRRRMPTRKHRNSTHYSKKNMKDADWKRNVWSIVLVNVLNLVLLAFLFILFFYRKYAVETGDVSCPYGFFGEDCQRDDFVDTVSWFSSGDYTAVDGECSSGYSFRTWAPGAYQVRLFFKNPDSDVFSYYPMIKQANGFWFIIICTCKSGAQYKYLIDYHSNLDGYSLSLGGVERTMLSQEGSNIIVDSPDIANTKFVPVSSNPVFYQIHIPSYRYQEQTPLVTILQRLDTLALAGVNTIELNGLEFLNCDENKVTCWKDSSYSPGLLRPTIGTTQEIIKLIQGIHNHNMSVVIDLNWESFNRNTLLWSYHNFFQQYEMINDNTTDMSDVFRDTTMYCSSDRCPLDMSGNSMNSLLLLSVLKRYREVFGVDGIRWIVKDCSRFVGGDCSMNQHIRNDIRNDLVLNNFWDSVRELGFTIITSNTQSVPNYDLFLDTQFCTTVNSVKTSSKMGDVVMALVNLSSEGQTNRMLSLECYESLPSRLYLRSGYKVTSMLLSLFYLMPTNLHFFMGTVYMSDIPFVSDPKTLDLDAVGYSHEGAWMEPQQKYRKYQMTIAIASIRKQYLNDGNTMEVLLHDPTQSLVVLKVGNSTSPLMVVINYGRTAYSGSNQVKITIPAVHPTKYQGTWKCIFTTADNAYDLNTETVKQDLVFSSCNNNTNIRYYVCYLVTIGDFSVNVYSPVL